MDKVYVVSKYVFISEEDHYSEVLSVCSTEEIANKVIADLNCSPINDLDVSYSYEVFDII